MEHHPHNSIHVNPTADPEELIHLAEKIIERHGECGTKSPLKGSQVADLNYKVKCARDKHDEGLKYKKLMEAAWRERDQLMGTGQSCGLLQALANLMHTLEESYADNKSELTQWGLPQNP